METSEFALKFSKLYSSHLKYSWPLLCCCVVCICICAKALHPHLPSQKEKNIKGADLNSCGRCSCIILEKCHIPLIHWVVQYHMLCYSIWLVLFPDCLVFRETLTKWEIIRVYWAICAWKWMHRVGLLRYFTVYLLQGGERSSGVA